MSLPASITGAHAKKQGEDLSDNDGDEDEGIFHGEQRWCMSFFCFCFCFFFLKMSLFSDHYRFLFELFFFLFANALIRHTCHITICRTMLLIKCLSVCECEVFFLLKEATYISFILHKYVQECMSFCIRYHPKGFFMLN